MASLTSTQSFVPIENIRDGIILLKNGEYRVVIMTSSINLSLKSSDEQTAVTMQFQSLLNGLDFPLQIFVQSRKLDIKPYLEVLTEREKKIKEDLLKIQTREYIQFIDKFTSEANIMTKHFFIVIPYYPSLSLGSSSPQNILPFGGAAKTQEKSGGVSAFDQARIQILQRADSVIQSLSRFGVRSIKLTTEDSIELFYKQFNPGTDEHPAQGVAAQTK